MPVRTRRKAQLPSLYRASRCSEAVGLDVLLAVGV